MGYDLEDVMLVIGMVLPLIALVVMFKFVRTKIKVRKALENGNQEVANKLTKTLRIETWIFYVLALTSGTLAYLFL